MGYKRAAIGVMAVCTAVVAGCGSSTPRTTPRSVLRGAAVSRFACPPRPRSAGELVRPIGPVLAFRLCPLDVPGQAAKTVTVTTSQAVFQELVAALSAPDESSTTGACPAYADVPQLILANTRNGAYQVSVPVDACHHYQRAALEALNRARGS